MLAADFVSADDLTRCTATRGAADHTESERLRLRLQVLAGRMKDAGWRVGEQDHAQL